MSAEQSASQPSELAWFKSSYSGTNGGDCVEVAAAPGTVHVRDSKDSGGPVLSFPTTPGARSSRTRSASPTSASDR